jgi:regulator of protease activity HflC (stomatin/prohibitin superfamily)
VKNRILGALLVAALLLTGACASVNTKAGEAAIAYTGGPIEGTSYDKVIKPGSGLVWLGVSDDYYLYPTTQRDYIVSRETNEGDRKQADFIAATNKDGVIVEWELAVYFKLNVSKLRKFHENIGLRYNAYLPKGSADTSEDNLKGWDTMLNNVFRQQIESTIQRVTKAHSTDELQRSADIFDALEREVGLGLKDQVNAAVGDNYFCGPDFNGDVAEDNSGQACADFRVVIKAVKQPSVDAKYAEQKQAEINVITAQRNGDANVEASKKQAEANIAEAEGKRRANEALANIYRDPNFIAYLNALAAQACAGNKDHCTMVITGTGTGVNVNVQP